MFFLLLSLVTLTNSPIFYFTMNTHNTHKDKSRYAVGIFTTYHLSPNSLAMPHAPRRNGTEKNPRMLPMDLREKRYHLRLAEYKQILDLFLLPLLTYYYS